MLLRVGAVMAPDKHPDTRITADGQWAVRRGRGETFISGDVAYRDGAYYP